VIGDPSGRTTARSRGKASTQKMNTRAMHDQLSRLWNNVKALGIKHQYPSEIDRNRSLLNNKTWLEGLTAVQLMSDVGSGMRLGSMLARDS
jgi:tyrosyl-tRNA synthetase